MLTISVSGSKSTTNRALLAAALANGASMLARPLESDDTVRMSKALEKLGGRIQKKKKIWKVRGGNLTPSKTPLDCGNSGTTMRFLAAVLAAQPFPSVLTGDARMRKRPIEDLARALRELGARVDFLRKDGFPPIRVCGPLKGGFAEISGQVSSQFLSGLLMAAPLAHNDVTLRVTGELVSAPYIDLTLEILKKFCIRIAQQAGEFRIPTGQRYQPTRIAIEGDASAASYFWGIGGLTGDDIRVSNVPKNCRQADMACQEILARGFLEQQGSLRIESKNFPDSAMTLAVLAAFRKGKTVLRGLANLRIKECDRLHALATELAKIGADVRELPDGLEIRGQPLNLHAGKIETYNDHRMAMCFGMAGFVIPGMKIKNPGCVRKTYPDFWRDRAALKKQFLEKNIILTGMRGSGKTVLGKALGRLLARRFIDLDQEIEKMTGKTVRRIVVEKGWKHFRELEHRAVRKIAQSRHTIIATGGGTLIFPRNAAILKKNGKVIFLNCPLAVLKKRLRGAFDRPSLQKGKHFLAELENVFKKREKRYKQVSDAIFDASGNEPKKMVEALASMVYRFGMGNF